MTEEIDLDPVIQKVLLANNSASYLMAIDSGTMLICPGMAVYAPPHKSLYPCTIHRTNTELQKTQAVTPFGVQEIVIAVISAQVAIRIDLQYKII